MRFIVSLSLVLQACSRSPGESVHTSGYNKEPTAKTDVIAVSGACAGACFVFVLFYVTVSALSKKPAKSRDLCTTEDCVRHAALLTEQVDWNLDPCDDFEAFVCSGWHKRSLQQRDLIRSVLDDLRFAWYDRFEDVLTEGALELSTGRKPLAMYRMCREYFPSNASQIAAFRVFIETHGLRWPEPPAKLLDPLQLLVALSYLWEAPFLITVGLMYTPDSSAGRRRRVVLGPGAYLEIMRYHHLVVERAYVRYWEEFLVLFYPDGATRPALNQTLVEELRAIDKYVVDTLHAVTTSSRKRAALILFRDVGLHIPNASTESWLNAFQHSIPLEPKLGIYDEIVATDISLLRTVSALLTTYTRLQLNRYLTWLIVQYCAPVADYGLLVSFHRSKARANVYLPMYCGITVEATYKVLVLALATSTMVTQRDRDVIDAGFNSILSAAVRKVNETSWMDDYSKSRAIHKLESTRTCLWPPESLLRADRLDEIYAGFPEDGPSFAHYWIESRKELKRLNRTREYAEARLLPGNNFPDYLDYDYVNNVVKLAIGAAAPPAYYRNGTQAMLYGGLLFLFALQLVKAIDEEGIKWAPNALEEQASFLSNSTLEMFRTRAVCGQADSYNGTAFPDVPALEIAYAALNESHLRGEEVVPLALEPDLTEDKVFFMTLCYMSCAKSGDRKLIPADCNKVARNSRSFAKAYNCKEGTRMNPGMKCSFFA
ncbi:hypothetical protein HPB50_022341 [Hyalomma asiaticum]|uniref:Uncharacterized protein n=1 Tax=Hyalomma asiaticum TaxID=266040 RepID=A0ACB7RV40_HYAAI|nr:hypothetical protein HPB50_022341 [Hyalomma asiaticum]